MVQSDGGLVDILGAERSTTDWRTQFGRALVFLRPDRGLSLLALALILVGAAIMAVEPLVFMYLFDQLAAGEVEKAVMYGAAAFFGLGLLREIVGGVSNWITWRVRLRVNYRILEATVDRLHGLPLTFHRKQSVGGVMTIVEKGIQGYITALHEFAFNIIPTIAYLIMALVFMFQLDWRLSLLVLAFAPLPAVIAAFAVPEQMRRERTLLHRWGHIYSRFNEVLSGIVTVKSFAMEDAEKRRFLTDVHGANGVVDRGVARDTGVNAAKNFVALLARVAAIALGAVFLMRGEVTVGTLLAFLGYIGGLFGPVQGLTGTYQTIRRAGVSLDAIYSIIDAHDPLEDAPDARPVPTVRGTVEFEKVSFHYERPDAPVLRDVNLRVTAGETVAIVGPSGAGKTTLMALLLRLYDPVEGAVRVDGHDVRSLQQRDLRRHVGVVLQDALLFNDTVRNAIAYAKPDATQEEIEAAAKAANCHDFIMSLPNGYDTIVGERGSRLSGGERQRVAIARALLKDPPILVLDEATSALDAESEALVQEALSRLIAGRTTFIIAHRLSTVVGADRILVLQDGRISESGTHDALLEKNGYYASLVRHQTKGLIKGLRDWPGAKDPRPLPVIVRAAGGPPPAIDVGAGTAGAAGSAPPPDPGRPQRSPQ